MSEHEWTDPALIAAYETFTDLRRQLTTAQLELARAQEELRKVQAMASKASPKAVGAVVERYFKEYRRLYEDPK